MNTSNCTTTTPSIAFDARVTVTVSENRFVVSKDFLADVSARLREVRPALMMYVAYTPEDLYGHEDWHRLSRVEQRMVVICLKHLARRPGSSLVESTDLDPEADLSGKGGANTFEIVI